MPHILKAPKTKFAKAALLCLTMVSLNISGNAQVKQAGKNFWLTLGGNSSLLDGYVIITSRHHAAVLFQYTTTGVISTYNIAPGEVLQIKLTMAEMQAISVAYPRGSTSDKSLNIQSDSDIVVHFSTTLTDSEDGMLIYPSDKQIFGDTYYLIGSPPLGGGYRRAVMFSMVATCDSTEIEITPSVIIAADTPNTQKAVGISYTIKLNKGQTYQFSPIGSTALAGTKIKVLNTPCCNPLNVFMTYPVTNIYWKENPAYTCCADELCEQILPVNVWDTLYPIANFHNNSYNRINIVSARDNNVVSMDGTPFKTLMAGGHYDTIIDRPVIIRSLYPTAITEYMTGQFATIYTYYGTSVDSIPADSLSDPDVLICLSFKDGLKETYFKSVGQSYRLSNNTLKIHNRLHVLTVISPAANINSVMLNGVSLAGNFRPFAADPGVMFARIKLDTGVVHHLVSQENVIAYYNAAAYHGSVSFNLGNVIAVDSEVAALAVRPDTVNICMNESTTLSAGEPGKYTWSTGDTTGYIQVSSGGNYSVLIQGKENCNEILEKFVVIVKDYVQVEIADSIYKCTDELITLTTDVSATSVLWNNGNTTQSIMADTFGNYHALLTWQHLCKQATYQFNVLPLINKAEHIQVDTTICKGDVVVLLGKDKHTLWSTGATGNTLQVSEPGLYWFEWTDSCSGVSYRDTVLVSDSICLYKYCNMAFPTAFTPNGDSRNDVFRPVYHGLFTDYHMGIYNRWGERIYEAFKETEEWDGTYKGIAAELGVYYYICTYNCPLKGDLFIKGEVTLIR